MASGNANPVNNVERYWEAIDLITKALSQRDGPFSWEGKHFTHRHVNIWPRPWQHPHPRMWSATGDPETAAEVGRRGMVHVLVLRGPEGTRRAYAAHRKARAEAGLPKVTTDNFAYAAFVYVGDTDEEGLRVGSKLLWFLHTSLKSAPPVFEVLAGQRPAARRAADLSHGSRGRGRAGQSRQCGERGCVSRPECGAPHVAHRRAGDRPGHLLRGQPRHRLQAGDGVLRQGRGVRAPEPGRPLRLHDPRRVGKEHPALLEGSAPSAARDQTRHRRLKRVGLALLVVSGAALVAVGCLYRPYLTGFLPSAAAEMGDINLPPGFRIAVYAGDVPNARPMAAGPDR